MVAVVFLKLLDCHCRASRPPGGWTSCWRLFWQSSLSDLSQVISAERGCCVVAVANSRDPGFGTRAGHISKMPPVGACLSSSGAGDREHAGRQGGA
jgi:hypothetical protein